MPVRSGLVDRVMKVMETAGFTWFFVGGWALDLALGRQTREHADVDLCCFREHLGDLLGFFEGWDRQVAVKGEGRTIPVRSESDVLPSWHELHFSREDIRLEFLLIEHNGNEAVFRREPSIRFPVRELIRRDELGRPFAAPAWTLLFKAKYARSKDHDDFQMVAPRLPVNEKKWLMRALRIHLPDSPWISQLEGWM
jgi:hypothetical protein